MPPSIAYQKFRVEQKVEPETLRNKRTFQRQKNPSKNPDEIYRYRKLSETPKGHPAKFFGTVGQTVFESFVGYSFLMIYSNFGARQMGSADFQLFSACFLSLLFQRGHAFFLLKMIPS